MNSPESKPDDWSETAGNRRCIRTPNAPPPIGPYCQGNIAGPFVFTAAMGGDPPSESDVFADSVERQTEQALKNIAAILEAGGCSLADVCKVTAYLADLTDFRAMNAVYARFFQQPYPARSIVESKLPAPGAKVAFDAIALRS